MASDGSGAVWVVLFGAWLAFSVGKELGRERGERSPSMGVVRKPISEHVRFDTFVFRKGGEDVVQALRSPRDDDRAGLVAYLAGAHDTAAVLAAQELDAGCCEPAAIAFKAALDHWQSDLDRAIAAAPPDSSPVLVLWQEASHAPLYAPTAEDVWPDYGKIPRAEYETLPKDRTSLLIFLLRGGFTQQEVKKKFPTTATDPTLLRCLPR